MYQNYFTSIAVFDLAAVTTPDPSFTDTVTFPSAAISIVKSPL